jgi:hypothetical protein
MWTTSLESIADFLAKPSSASINSTSVAQHEAATVN